MKNGFLIGVFFVVLFFSCKRKEDKITIDPQAKLSFSTSTIFFDTIFTSVGSVTKRLWVYNKNKNALSISEIKLADINSPYKMIINGEETRRLTNYTIKGNDSVLVLVSVLINPQNQSLAYLVEDSIVFATNGNIQDVDLTAYGQDAFFFNNETVPCDVFWENTKPYVIKGTLRIAPGCTLTIDRGSRILFHNEATLKVEGTLLVYGEKDSMVYFRQDKLSAFYNHVPGQWKGIEISSGSKNNFISFAEIKNSVTAFTLKNENDSDTIAELRIENSSIKNTSSHAVQSNHSDVYMINTLINNSIGYLFRSSNGGNFYFDYCTFANYSYDFFRENVGLRFSNKEGESSNPLTVRFRNSIVWGDKSDEIEFNNQSGNSFSVAAYHSLFKSAGPITGTSNIVNQDPLFENIFQKKFTLTENSPALDNAEVIPEIDTDLEGKIRGSEPDRGCYER